MNFKGFPIVSPEAGSMMADILTLKDLNSLFRVNETVPVGINSLAWFNFRAFLARPDMYPDIIAKLSKLGNIRNPTEEELTERFQNPNKYNGVRFTYAKHIAIKDDKHPFVVYMHLMMVEGSLKWVFKFETIPFLSRGKDHEEVQQIAA